MRHCSQASASVFMQKGVHENGPTTIQELRQGIANVPDNKIVDHLM